jgi:hypothetical protein
LNPLDITVKRYSSVEFNELQKGGLVLKEKKQDREEQDSEILLDFKTASSRDRDVRKSPHIQEDTEELAEPNDSDDDIHSNIDVHRQTTPEALKEQVEPQRAVEGRL